MSELHIQGGIPLEGSLTVQGAKNSVLPLLAACLLVDDAVELTNCPVLSDVSAALSILRHLGCETSGTGHTVTVDASGACGVSICREQMRKMRSSIIFLGPLLARMGEAHVSCPGGCELGPRPIDLHLQAMRNMGCRVQEDEAGIHCWGRPAGGQVRLPFPSVGATENAMLCAVGGTGTAVIFNAAREPEIVQLQEFLNGLGACVWGAGGSVITVEGGRRLHAGNCRVMADRIVASTLLCAAAAAGGEICLSGVDWRQVSTVLSALSRAGCRVESTGQEIRLSRMPEMALTAAGEIRTGPYPAFPTDAQAPLMAVMCTAAGETEFIETMFDSRFRHVLQLRRMGAEIRVAGRRAEVRGGGLNGAAVSAPDLRGGAALAVAALAARGSSVISGVHHIDRGYESLEEMLRRLGAVVSRKTG